MAAPTKTAVQVERERLRGLGWTDEDIQKIMIEREVHRASPQTGAPVPVQTPMSGVLGNASAVLSHVRGTIPAIKADAANLANSGASRTSRTKSAAVLVGVAVLVVVLGYAIYREWQQHIISQTEIAAAQAQKLRIEADNAKALNEAQVKKLEAEAAVAKQVNEAQAAKLRAEAAVAEQVAAGAAAKSCSERLQLIASSSVVGDIEGNGAVKPDTQTARMLEKYNKDCGVITGAATSNPKPSPTREAAAAPIWALIDDYTEKAWDEFAAGHYDAAYQFAKKRRESYEDLEKKFYGGAGERTASALAFESRNALFARNYAGALDAAERGNILNPFDLVNLANKAEAQMFMGRKLAAATWFLYLRSQTASGKPDWPSIIVHDFADLRKAGITSPLMSEIETALSCKAGVWEVRAGSDQSVSYPQALK